MPGLLNWGALAVLSPAWYYMGRLAQLVRLPLITGYLLGGVLCGPYALQLLTIDALDSLKVVDHGCLAIIALAAGAELNFTELKRTRRQVTAITMGISLCSWILTFGAMMLLLPNIELVKGSSSNRIIGSMATLAATLAMARSPASAIAILNEVSGKGPFCSLVLSVVVVKDVLVFICFAVNIELVSQILGSTASSLDVRILVQPLFTLLMSAVLGVIGGSALSILLRTKPADSKAKPVAAWMKSALIICAAPALFNGAEVLRAEPLLCCVMAGLVCVNIRSEILSKDIQEELGWALNRVMPAVQVAFFGLVGAALKLDALLHGLWLGVLLYFVRLLGVYMGGWMGCWLGGTSADVRRRLWATMVTQAGIALGLAKTVAGRFPQWGVDFATLLAPLIMMNLLTGPPLFKSVVMAMGEAAKQEGKGKEKEVLPNVDDNKAMRSKSDPVVAKAANLKEDDVV